MSSSQYLDDSNFEFGGTERFRIQRRLGAGGMGVVYEALDRERNELVALKTLRRTDPHSLYRLKREFRALQDLQHPNLVTLGELIEHAGRWFFTMELIRGVSFLRWVRGGDSDDWDSGEVTPSQDTLRAEHAARERVGGELDEARLRSAFTELVTGLSALHAAGKVHRDIKPSNVMVSAEGRVVLLDFGLIAETRQSGETTEAHIVGTAEYMAPEQAAQKPVGPAADWYAAGVMLYEALTGEVPFSGTPLQLFIDKQAREAQPPETIAPGSPRDLSALCVDLLRLDPGLRPTADDILARLGSRHRAPRPSALGLSRDSPFVGRDRELAALHDAWDEARDRGPVTVFVHGESGVGKSELMEQFVQGLERHWPNLVLLRGRCYERESVPYRAFDGVADNLSHHLLQLSDTETRAVLPRRAALLGRLFPVLRRVEAIANAPPVRDGARDPHEQRTRMFGALRELLARLAERRPVAIAIDDFQWADADSKTLLAELLHAPEAPPLLLVSTVRCPANDEALGAVLGALVEQLDDYRALPVEGLSLASARALLARAGGVAAEDDELTAMAEEARGHPMYLLELARHSQGGAGRVRRLDEILWHRVTQLPDEARVCIELMAVAGAPISRQVLAHAARLTNRDLDRVLAMLRFASLGRASGPRETDVVEPYHDRVRQAVLASLDDDALRAHHGRMASALERSGAAMADALALVRHLEGAGDADYAARRAREAATRATDALAFDLAAELYRTALRLGSDGDAERRALGLALADACANAGRGQEAAEAYLEVSRDTEDASLRMDCRRKAAWHLLISGRIEPGLGALEELLRDIGSSMPRTPRAALSRLIWNRACLRARGLAVEERQVSEVPERQLRELDVLSTVARGLALIDIVRGSYFQARALRRALALGEPSRLIPALALEAIYQSTRGGRSLVRAEALLQRVDEMAERHGDPYVLAWRDSAAGTIAFFAGRFPEAAEHLGSAVVRFRDHAVGATWELNSARMFRLFALRHGGELARAHALYEEYIRDAVRRGDRYLESSMRRYGAVLLLALDRPDAARDNLARASWPVSDGQFHIQHWWELEALAELAIYEDRAAGALAALAGPIAALDRSLLTRVQSIRALFESVHARLHLSAATAGSDAGAHLAQAERLARRMLREKVPYAVAWAETILGGVANQRGDRAGALAHLRGVETLARQHHLKLTVAAARFWRGSLLAGPEGAQLSADGEAQMLAQGVRHPARMARLIAPGFSAD